jgi:hypothetical protein
MQFVYSRSEHAKRPAFSAFVKMYDVLYRVYMRLVSYASPVTNSTTFLAQRFGAIPGISFREGLDFLEYMSTISAFI